MLVDLPSNGEIPSSIDSDSKENTLGNRSTGPVSGHDLGDYCPVLRLTGGRRSEYSGSDFLRGERDRASSYLQVHLVVAGNRICPVCRGRTLVVVDQTTKDPRLAT